jgi:hypothetical protein
MKNKRTEQGFTADAPQPFDPHKPVMTRCGWAARIICIDRDDLEMPIVALTLVRAGHGEGVVCYRADGRYGQSSYPTHDLDLVNVIAGRGFKRRRVAAP